ncbi:1-phosphatidylinositol-4-phosphate 5-kinase [Angomonas deanei]|uniref:Phosphatidylinositol-4-phosphate 5-Kinase, putative n=1 Tax=Angomonas deanei TaxID=59799 RepID=A0A7G2C563_9TRYP|nr:1-phosphatidylinositol-4-phosphate 5-kinase [Angomonas deanei]CAD2214635.1 Phosphatidylinositol-4-phosphate 5-Kinase, putative [Angomonas deanei]|eukprot:EPY22396.1 1-phosphatidylinositol-4-phosphate 5-kinase [Angomonas deanei]
MSDHAVTPISSYERQRRRLKRENHLLRRQILRMQEARRNMAQANAAEKQTAVNTVRVPSSSVGVDSTALQMRIQSLQKQNEREKARRLAGEKELRYEIELLRLALDEAMVHPRAAKKSDDGYSSEVSSTSSHGPSAEVKEEETFYDAEVRRNKLLYEQSVQRYNAETGVPSLEEGHAHPSGSYQLPKDDLLARTASRREQRRQRLQKIDPISIESDMDRADATGSSVSHVPDFTQPSPQHPGSKYPQTGPVLPLHFSPHARKGEEEEEESDPFATTATQEMKSEMPVFNPNQIGVEIKEDEKNRTWYTQKLLALAFLQFFPPARRHTAVLKQKEEEDTNVVVTGVNRVDSDVSSSQGQTTSDRRRTSILGEKEVDTSILSASDSESDRNEESRRGSKVSSPLHKSGDVVKAEGVLDVGPAGNEEGGAFVYRQQNPIALQRAIEESFSLHCRCKGNEPCLQQWRTAETQVYPPFETENSDLNLIHSFMPEEDANNKKPKKKHKSKKNDWRDDEVRIVLHAPVVFSQIRDFLHMDVDNFRLSMEKSVWRQSMSPGKSGTTLYYFGNYVMKTVHESEFQFFIDKYLPAYVQYCERNPHTLLPRFYAVLTLKWLKLGITKRFVLMHNVFATHYYIHRIYDVKGSTVGRTALQPGKAPPRTAFGALLLKDNDLPSQLIICGSYQRAIVLAQFRSDVDFLQRLNIVDYSCMIGVRSRVFSREEGPSQTIFLRRKKNVKGAKESDYSNFNNIIEEHATTLSNLEAGDAVGVGGIDAADGYICIHGCDGGLLSLPIYAPGDDTTAREDVYYLGIIDVLQEYNSVKKLENFAKGFVNDKTQISVIPPKDYAERLYKRLERITI